ncbi:hypothetical protein E5K00_08750 [Hymenobacter aquaticus]|uniref:Secreted protein n=1 Tax=Hymenobacter aquaticus TaxID=1867101 RepID=A0A4Z0Q974_9BACT|nr:hypothetical protein [Hymenobacter aquaticus]TGE25262.1 hypothetical protein E5K00_08750 [Hymenobacter aquaticus]
MRLSFSGFFLFLLTVVGLPTPGHSAPGAVAEGSAERLALAPGPAGQGDKPGARGRSTTLPVKSVPHTQRQSKPQRVEAGARSARAAVGSARGERTERTARSARSSRGAEGGRGARSGGSSRSMGGGAARGHGRGH